MNIFCKITNEKSGPEKSPDEAVQEEVNSISERDLRRLYSVEYKSQSYASFFNTSMEKDKSILTLSVAGVGFALTLLKLADSIQIYDIAIFISASLCFLGSIYSVVTMFGKNADFIVDLTTDKDVTLKQDELKRLDKKAIRFFYVGIVLTIILGLSTSIRLVNEDSTVSKPEDTQTTQHDTSSGLEVCMESLQQASDITKSLAAMAELQPTEKPSANQTNSSTSSGAESMKPDTD
ncbi:hypothetical protein [Vibrio coralliilyticus]|uniref:Uncharacterized protein n=1 Tax=Vibrio coralliilyticus TaxID=190893 RepID=A0AAP6ZNM4_9VIBR|nr:hypothetical protein [Vibrio coralliilyticus]NOJ22153.1 hypothetical protein [Vibrio coralliilyticus]